MLTLFRAPRAVVVDTPACSPHQISSPPFSCCMVDEQNGYALSSLNGTLSKEKVDMSLTEAGLLVARTEAVVRLYAKCHSWTEVKTRWHEERVHERGSRGSAQQIFRIIKRRLQAGADVLPPISELCRLVEQCPTRQAKAQLFYFYLVRDDNLFRFALHEILRQQGIERDEWHVTTDALVSVLEGFQLKDGSNLPYADSTLRRWGQGFRSVLRDIGVLQGPYDEDGTIPTVDVAPAHLGALYSWNEEGTDWPSHPIGWMYLFQPSAHREALLERLQSTDRWTTSRLRNQTIIAPAERKADAS